MALTSPLLAVALGTTVTVLLAGILLGWRRLAGRGARRVALRAIGLCALQASVLGLVFVLVNNSLVFYSSWSDLAGSDTGGGTVHAAAGGSAGPADSLTVLSRSAVTVPGLPRVGGRLDSVRIHGALSGLTVSGHLFLPPGYGGRASRRLFPVIVVISNRGADRSAPYGALSLAAAAAAQIAAGRLPPAILLFLPAGLSSSDQGCLNQPGGVQAQTFFAQDVPRVLQTAAAASSSASQWALLGDQSGGYCALQLALDDSGVFSVAAAPPASYARPPGPGAAGSPQLSQQDDLLWQLRHLPPQPLSVLVAGPGAAPGLGPARELAALARPPMHVASASLAPGRWPLTPVLDWIGAVLRAPAPLTAGPR
ncbi:MAG TPA: alpha/beta hydrolase-fold protein [Streptosporangiaceae bacterium]|jgi:hypothetical protein